MKNGGIRELIADITIIPHAKNSIDCGECRFQYRPKAKDSKWSCLLFEQELDYKELKSIKAVTFFRTRSCRDSEVITKSQE